MITIKHRGNFNRTERFFDRVMRRNARAILDSYGLQGVNALSSATPRDTGETANSWSYKISLTSRGYKISWINTNVQNGVPIAILLQYGHGTRNGGYVVGKDYINPAMRPIFDELAKNLWEEVSH